MAHGNDLATGKLGDLLPGDWEEILARNVAHFGRLNAEEQCRIRGIVRRMVPEKNWEGCRGLRITDDIKVTIAAQAGLLILGRDYGEFRRVGSILVYPFGFVVPGGSWMDDPELGHSASGQAHYRGPVILSWDSVLREGQDPSTGHNLVIHEFAHQLDFLDGLANGTPALEGSEQLNRWGDVMTQEFDHLRRQLRRGRRTFLGSYAATNPAEFFAVTTERFFTVPAQLHHFHAEVFHTLVEYFAVDPLRWYPSLNPA